MRERERLQYLPQFITAHHVDLGNNLTAQVVVAQDYI